MTNRVGFLLGGFSGVALLALMGQAPAPRPFEHGVAERLETLQRKVDDLERMVRQMHAIMTDPRPPRPSWHKIADPKGISEPYSVWMEMTTGKVRFINLGSASVIDR